MAAARWWCCVILLLTAMLVGAVPASSEGRGQKQGSEVQPAVVEIYMSKGEMDCRVNGVACGLGKRDFLYMLSRIYDQHGPNWPVAAIFHPEVPVEWVGGVQGIAEKAQLKNVRCFVVSEFAPVMTEIEWGVQIPYSRKLSRIPPKK